MLTTPTDVDRMVSLYNSGDSLDTIALKIGPSAMTVRKHLRRRGINTSGRRATRYAVIEDTFADINTHAKAQMLGLLCADGNVTLLDGRGGSSSVRIELQERDKGVLEQMRNLLGYTGPFYRTKKQERWYVKLQITRRRMVEDLIQHGCVPRKTFTLQLPSLPPDLMGSFLYGYWLGDGWITISTRAYKSGSRPFKLSFISTDAMCHAVAALIKQRFGVSCAVLPHWRTKGVSELCVRSQEGFRTMWEWMSRHKILDIPRKTAKAQEVLQYISSR